MTRPIVISSKNGLEGTRLGYEMLVGGADALDAAIATVRTVEDDPDDLTVGYGGLPNEEGEVELDAAVMHGPTHRCGGVAGLTGVRHAADVAKLVLETTNHVLLVGDGARKFAHANGFVAENLLTERARKIWLYWKQMRSSLDDWIPPAAEQVDPEVARFFNLFGGERTETATTTDRWNTFDRPTGTIHASAVDAEGNVSCTTTTSGLAFKIPGRVGDTPIVGAGLFCDNEVGSCGSTGRGEASIEQVASHAVVELMRNGAPPEEAGLEVLRRMASKTEPRLRDEQGRPRFNVKLYPLSTTGEHGGVALWGPATYAVTDADGTRLEPMTFLYERV